MAHQPAPAAEAGLHPREGPLPVRCRRAASAAVRPRHRHGQPRLTDGVCVRVRVRVGRSSEVGGSGVGGTGRFPRWEQGLRGGRRGQGEVARRWPRGEGLFRPSGFLPGPEGSRPSCRGAEAVRVGKRPRWAGPRSLKGASVIESSPWIRPYVRIQSADRTPGRTRRESGSTGRQGQWRKRRRSRST